MLPEEPGKVSAYIRSIACIDWTAFEKELYYKVCKRSIVDAAGRAAYNPLDLFKMMLLQSWYHLFDLLEVYYQKREP